MPTRQSESWIFSYRIFQPLEYTLGLQLFANTNFSDFYDSMIWWVLILVDL